MAGRVHLIGMFLVLVGCGVEQISPAPVGVSPGLPSDFECSMTESEACGDPIENMTAEWAWYPVSDSKCLDGSSTGFGVRIGQEPEKVVLYLEGGGACYNSWSCENIFASKFGAEDFGEGKQVGIFNLDDGDNPFKAWTHVYIPYCSGDMHSGSVPFGEGYAGQAHWGYQNISYYLKRLVPTFKTAQRVVLMGSSAGGFGATYNWLRVQKAFNPVPVDVIDDSGPFFTSSFLDSCFHKTVSQLWNQSVVFPSDCTDCLDSADSFIAHLRYTRRQLPERRYALLTEAEDYVIRAYFSYGTAECSQWDSDNRPDYSADRFHSALEDYRHATHDLENTYIYEAEGNGHVMLFSDFSDGLQTVQNGIPLAAWLNDFIGGADLEDVIAPKAEGSGLPN